MINLQKVIDHRILHQPMTQVTPAADRLHETIYSERLLQVKEWHEMSISTLENERMKAPTRARPHYLFLRFKQRLIA